MAAIQPNVTTLGYWGKVSSPALSVNLNAAGFDAATKSGGVLNIRQYRKGNESGYSQAALGLDFKNVYSDVDNATAAWSTTAAIPQDFQAIPNAFNTGSNGVFYKDGSANASQKFTSTFTVAKNRPFSFKLFLFEKHEHQPRQVVALTWNRWRFEVVDGGSPQILRTTPAWTAAKQTVLDSLLNTEEQLTESQQSTVDTLRQAIYEADFSQGVTVKAHKTDAGNWFEVTFLPEPRGILNILSEDNETSIELPAILNTRDVGEVWPASPLILTTTGGAMFWQIGFPAFAKTGYIRTNPLKWWNQTAPGGATFQGQLDQSSPNTSIALTGLTNVPDTIAYYAQAAFTSDGTYSPFLYAVEGFVGSGDRSGSGAESWNSDDALDFDDNGTPIRDFTPNYDQNRKKSASILLRYRPGTLNLPGTGQQLLQSRMVNVTLDETPFITRGIVLRSQVGEARAAAANVADNQTCHNWTTLLLEIADQWAIMDSDLMLDNPKGDGKYLGAYIRTVLKGAGVKNSEMTGVGATTGRILPSAAPGEDFLIQPGSDCNRGDYLRSLVADWGMGLQLYISNAGIWTLAFPDTTPVAAFSSSATSGYRILEPLDIIRDYGDTYNWFCVEGAEINGQRLRGTWTIQESLSQPTWLGYVGHYRRFPTIRNEAIRTKSELNYVGRSRAIKHGRPGRFFAFTTNFHKNLDIGMYITMDGVLCEIVRIDGGSIVYNNDRMNIVAQEVINPIPTRLS